MVEKMLCQITFLVQLCVIEVARVPLKGPEFNGNNGKFKYMWLCINKLIDDLHLRNHTR